MCSSHTIILECMFIVKISSTQKRKNIGKKFVIMAIFTLEKNSYPTKYSGLTTPFNEKLTTKLSDVVYFEHQRI